MTPLAHAFPAVMDTADGPAVLSVVAHWDPATPAVMFFDFDNHAGEVVRWEIGRELVGAALVDGGEHGEGDVVLSSTMGHLLMVLRGDAGELAPIRMGRAGIAWLVAESTAVLPPRGADETAAIHAALDAELSAILASAGGAE